MNRRIGITQRVADISGYGERRDCLDQRWAAVLAELGLVPVPLCNCSPDVDGYLRALDLRGVILSGGNDIARLEGARDTAPERDAFEWRLIERCLASRIPLAGVCRGMQALNLYFGGRVRRLDGHAARRHAIEVDGVRREVNSYHGWGIAAGDLGDGLYSTASADDGTVEALSHSSQLCHGIMWHPEREPRLELPDAGFLCRVFSTNGEPWR
jgi:gamma-glutamyl-gamma-aminobutyrate hydrolase PuuD